MKVLFVDDEFSRFVTFKAKNPNVEVFWAQTCYVAKTIFDTFHDSVAFDPFDVIMLDHDLCIEGSIHTTVREFVEYLSHRSRDLCNTRVITHSANPPGRNWICSVIRCENRPLAFAQVLE